MTSFNYAPGDRPLAGYTIEYALGKGGFGEVYFAKSDAGREVALKAILEHEEVELRGVQNCMNVKSPRLLAIHDVRRAQDETVWIVMEYVRGPSLQDIIAESPNGLEPEQAMYLLRELALGLSDLHNAGIVHRDLKPSNVFFDGGRVKIGDYSLSKSIASHEQSQHTMTVGSVHYMAPEISLGRYDKTVDIYALGIIFFELLTGHPPHTGETVGEVLMKHLHSDVDVGSIASPLQQVIQRATSREPMTRYQTPEEFAKAAMQVSGAGSVADSFGPATLSLIGQRAQKERMHAAAVAEQEPRSVAIDHPRKPRVRSLELRILHAATLVSATTAVQVFFSNRGGLGAFDGMLFALGVFGAAMIPAYRLLRWPRHDDRVDKPWREIPMRIVTATFAAAILAVYSTFATPLEMEGLVMSCLGSLLALSIIDWRKYVRPDRGETLQWYPTVAAGVVATLLCVALRMSEWWLFCSCTAIGMTLALQAIAPCSREPKEGRQPSRRWMRSPPVIAHES